MARYLHPPMRGKWSLPGYPPEVIIVGRRFRKATRVRPKAAAEYREAVPHNSAHLVIWLDGTWEVSHVDANNPEYGATAAALHLVRDVL
jgi:hypothetical protein